MRNVLFLLVFLSFAIHDAFAQIPVLLLNQSRSSATFEPTIVVTPPYTIEFWVQSFTGDDHIARTVLGFLSDSGTVDAVMMNNGNQIEMRSLGLQAGGFSFQDAWHHVAFVVRSDHAVLYVNGVFVGNQTGQFSGLQINELGRRIFNSSTDTTYFRGVLTQLRIWRTVRSESEIRENMHLSNGVDADITFTFEQQSDTAVWDEKRNYRCILRNGAVIQQQMVPVTNFLEETAAAWKFHPSAESGGIEVETVFDDKTSYLALGHSGDPLTFEKSTLRGVESWSRRYWGIVGVNVKHPTELVAYLAHSWDEERLAFVVDSTSSFENSRVLIGELDKSRNTLTLPRLPFLSDTVYIRLAQLPQAVDQITVSSSQGFGPFMQGYKNITTFRIDSFPSSARGIQFFLKSDTTVLDEQNTGSNIWRNVDLGRLPVNSYLQIVLSGDSTLPVRGYQLFRHIQMTVPQPLIRSSFGFLPFYASLDTTVTFSIGRLPPNTYRVDIKFAHNTGRTVVYRDSLQRTRVDSISFSGAKLDSVSYTVALSELQLPLSPILIVTVFHSDGYPGGSQYRVGFDVIADSVRLVSDKGFGPFVTKAPPVRCAGDECPEEVLNWFAAENLPRYTSKVQFEIVNRSGAVVDSSVHYISSSEQLRVFEPLRVRSKTFYMSNLPVDTREVRVRVWASGSADTGIVRTRKLQILAPGPIVRSSLKEMGKAIIARNPFDTSDHHRTYDTLFIIPSIDLSDTVQYTIAFLDSSATVLRDTAISVLSDADTVRFVYDAAGLPFICKKVRVTQSVENDSILSMPSEFGIVIFPGKPIIKTPIPLDSLLSGQMWDMPVHITGIPIAVNKMVVSLTGHDNSEPDLSWNMHGGGNFSLALDNGPYGISEITLSFWVRFNQRFDSTIIAYTGGVSGKEPLWFVSFSHGLQVNLEVNVGLTLAYNHNGVKRYADCFVSIPGKIHPNIEDNDWHRIVFVARFVDQGTSVPKLQMYAALDSQAIDYANPIEELWYARPYELNRFMGTSLELFPADFPGNLAEVCVFYDALPESIISRLPLMDLYNPVIRRYLIDDYGLKHYIPLNFHQNDEVAQQYGTELYSDLPQEDFTGKITSVRGVPARKYRPRWADTILKPSIPYAHFIRTDSTTAFTLFNQNSYGKVAAPDSFSILCWVRTTSRNGGKIVGFENVAAPNFGNAYDRHIYMSSDGRLHFGIWSRDKGEQVLSTQYPYNDGQWHHIAVTYKRKGESNGTMRLYVDGVRIDEKENVSIHGSQYLGYWRFGNGRLYPWEEAPQRDRCLEGDFTELLIFTTVLSGEEIAALKHREPPLDYTGLLHYLPMTGTSPDSVWDRKTEHYSPVFLNGVRKVTHSSSIHEAIVYRNFGMVVPEYDIQDYSLNVRIFYSGGPEEGVEYRYPVTVRKPWLDDFPIAFSTDAGGFGPFYEADRDSIQVTIRGLWGRDPEPTKVHLVKSTGDVLESARLHNGTASIDIGEAEPGSYFSFDMEFYDYDYQPPRNYEYSYGIAPYLIAVQPIIPPKIRGDFGPFIQSIADGAMEQMNTFDVIEFADEVQMVAEYYDAFGNVLRADTARKVQGNDSLWRFSTPMGSLSPPVTFMKLKTYNSASGDLLRTETRSIKIIRTRPSWFLGATFDDVQETADSVKFTIKVPYNVPLPRSNWLPLDVLTSLRIMSPEFPYIFPEIPLLAHQKIAFPQNFFTLHCSYAKKSQVIRQTRPESHMEVNVFGIPIKKSFQWDWGESDGTQLEFLKSGIRANQSKSFVFQQDLPTLRSVASFLKVIKVLEKAAEESPFYATIGFNFAFGLYLHHHYDTLNGQNGNVGSIGYPDDTAAIPQSASYEIVQLGGGLTLSFGVSVLDGLVGLSLDFIGRLLFGMGHQWVDLPTPKASGLQHATTLQIYGKVVLHYLFLGAKTLFGPKMIYHHQFGEHFPELYPSQGEGIFGLAKSKLFGKAGREDTGFLAHGFSSLRSDEDQSLNVHYVLTPEKFPQPAVSARDSLFLVLWIEEGDDDTRKLQLTQRSIYSQSFSSPVTVTENRNAITYPELCYGGGDYAVIVWMQSRYTPATVPYPVDPIDFLGSEDIWYAVYNVRARTVEAIGMIPDEVDGLNSGRIEGKPVVTALDSTRFLVVWHFMNGEHSDLLTVEIQKNRGMWNVALPPTQLLTEFSDHEISLQQAGVGTAVLTGVERGYTEAGTAVTRVNSWVYNGRWEGPFPLLSSLESGEHIIGMEQDFRNRKGMLLLLTTDTVNHQSVARIYQWDSSFHYWDPIPVYEWRDTIGLLTQPRVAISPAGIAAATFRRTSTARIQGKYRSQIDLIAIDLQSKSLRHHAASPYVCDTTAQVYAYDVGFASPSPSVLNIFLHEQRSMRVNDTVKNGMLWGNPDMKLVFRSVQLNDLLQLQDVPEDTLVIATAPYSEPGGPSPLIHLFPSPATNGISIQIAVDQPSDVTVAIYTLGGEKIDDVESVPMMGGQRMLYVPLQHLSSGTYICVVRVGDRLYQRQFLLVR